MDQKERLEFACKNINAFKEKNPSRRLSQAEKVCLEKLRLIQENPEYNNKLKDFYMCDAYCTSNDDVVLYIEVGRVKR